ncbi:50S ribosomal protein L9 [Nocardioides sp. WL0053]|jgi:large subunit ribosomal protein L9|uniref:Large ribosomal subunit protein bL9 n=1 Tax=Nocardioides jiangsuensis TaxID=2866161 RepID=A0ABS7RGI3_9ACTN|nr:50S ribosomal protein L9 [Nocardioides jiangsuensis]MBY9074145.1 50S ribosomal protein L9 [Nocardioides jiangsuensis]
MKLILTQEVTGLGAPGDVVEVKDGYGRNFLVPRGFAIRWTKGGERTIESIKAARATREVRDLDHAQQIKAKLEGSTFTLPVRAGEGGRLFGAVTVGDIASAITAAGAEVDKRKILVGNPIKSLGAHQVTVKVHDEVDATVNLNVVPA